MPTVTVSQAFAVAVQHHQAGRLAEAERIYRQIVNLDGQPESVEALHYLGIIAQQRGDHAAAIQQIRQALQLAPNNAAAWSNLGEALRCSGQLCEASDCLRRALELSPVYAEAHANRGLVLAEQGHLDEAVASYRRALQIKPDSPRVHNDMGIALGRQGCTDEALAAFRRALELQPGDADAWNNLGFALVQRKEYEQGIAAYREAIRRAPALVEVYNNLGAALIFRGELQEAIAAFQRTVELKPDHADARSNLASVYKDVGRFNEAVKEYRCALDRAPDHQLAHSNLIFTLYLHPDYDKDTIAREKARWSQKFASLVPPCNPPFEAEPDPERRLRIGYVSPDLRDHVHGHNLRPLFRWHDHQRHEILCYSGVVKDDALTKEFRGWADGWRSVADLRDEALADMIRQDRIDILVDLTQHLAGNRLLVFARQPAPLQVSFIGYPDGTGLEAIRYRLSDPYFETEIGDRRSKIGPELRTPSSNLRPAEQVLLLESFLCYEPSEADLEVNPLPALDNGWITFGCLNGFCKINGSTLAVWAALLRNASNSRLLFLSTQGQKLEQHQERIVAFLEDLGVKRERIQFAFPCPRRDYFALYHRVDIALDPFPYNGITTSLDALWMGVPVVSRVGPSPFSRAGLSQLSNLGLPELLAFSDADFVAIASRLAHDLPRLGEMRRTLRARMQSSPLMDGQRYAGSIEAAYRSMWRAWCKAPTRTAK